MIYGYILWESVFDYVKKKLPEKLIRNIKDHNYIQRAATEKDLIFLLKLGKGAQKLQEEFQTKGYNLYPNPVFSNFLRNRSRYLEEVDTITNYALNRIGFNAIYEVNKVPNISNRVVMKIGDYHCGENKWLLGAGDKVPYIKHKLRQEPVLFEEFLSNARSIRIGIVGNPNKEESYFITEHTNSEYAKQNTHTSWIKNISPIETTYLYHQKNNLLIPEIDNLINETREFAIRYNTDLIGVDWVVSTDKIGLLELNDMIGIPDDERVLRMFQEHILNLCYKHLGSY